jgi:hypothetical protein
MALLFGIASYLGQHAVVEHWLSWMVAVVVTLGGALAVSLGLSLPADLRMAVITRMAEMARRLGTGRA